MKGWMSVPLITILSTLVTVSGSVFLVKADESDMVEGDVIMINCDGYKKDRKGPVIFNHKKHAREYQISCWDCHHIYKGEKNIWSPWGKTQKCRDCHDTLQNQGEVAMLQKAYHLKCRDCHEALNKEGKNSGPYKECAGCHEKKDYQGGCS